MPPKLYPRLLLAVLTGLNILNYIDRNVLFAVQSDVKNEFLVSDAKIGIPGDDRHGDHRRTPRWL